MNLSERAVQYLGTLKRDDQSTSTEQETREYLINQNILPLEEFLRFQLTYSGYELTIKNDPGHGFSAHLFSKKQIKTNEVSSVMLAGDRFIEICGSHKRAVPFAFFLTDRGELCTLNDDDLPNILYSSFDKFVEGYALKNEIHSWSSNPYYFEVMKPESLAMFMNQKHKIVNECSDAFSTWWTNDDLIAVKGVWLDRPEFYFRVYGRERKLADDLIEKLKREDILKK